jgi:hypothetical protein
MKNREPPSRHLITTLFAFNDLLWLLVASFLISIALLLTQIQVMKTDEKKEDHKGAGSISVYMYWQDGIDLDLDIHLRCPEDNHVFYGSMKGHTCDLLRDDLGMAGDTGARNFENAYAHTLAPGQYIVNVHAFRGTKEMFPVEVQVEVVITSDSNAGKSSQKTFTDKITLYRVSEEATVVQFAIDLNKKLVESSVSHEFRSVLRKD